MPYKGALQHQRKRHQEVLEARAAGTPRGVLMLLEHDPPVVTVTSRPGVDGHVLAGEAQLARLGIERVATDRGGDVTYHGPGQLVVYPILDLNFLGLRIHGYIRLLEQAAIDTCAHFGVASMRDPEATGVWVDHTQASGGRKIGAIGVRVSRWATMHGLSLNVHPQMNHYEVLVPCGLHGRGVTSLKEELGGAQPTMSQVKEVMAQAFGRLLQDPEPFRDRRER